MKIPIEQAVMKNHITLLCVLAFSFFHPPFSYSQCEKEKEKYERLICELDELIKTSYDTLDIKAQYEKPIPKPMKKVNEANCDKIEKLIKELSSELDQQDYMNLDFKLKELKKTYIASLKIYVNSLRNQTTFVNYNLFADQFCSSNYQQSETAKGQLLNYIHFLEIKPPPDTDIKYHVCFAYGFYSSSIQRNLEDNFLPETNSNLSFDKLSLNFNFDYHLSNKVRAGTGIISIPETGSNSIINGGWAEQRVHGTAFNIHGTYLPFNKGTEEKRKRGLEIGFSFGIVTNILTQETKILLTDTSNTYTIFQHTETDTSGKFTIVVTDSVHSNPSTSGSLNEINYKNHLSSLGVFLSPSVNLYLNEYFSFQASLSVNLNSAISFAERRSGTASLFLTEKDVGFSSFSANAGITIHF